MAVVRSPNFGGVGAGAGAAARAFRLHRGSTVHSALDVAGAGQTGRVSFRPCRFRFEAEGGLDAAAGGVELAEGLVAAQQADDAEVLLKIGSRRPLVAASSRLCCVRRCAGHGVDGVGTVEQLPDVTLLASQGEPQHGHLGVSASCSPLSFSLDSLNLIAAGTDSRVKKVPAIWAPASCHELWIR